MRTTVKDLQPGQPVKFRRAGYTEDGLLSSKIMGEAFIVKDYVEGLIKRNRPKLKQIYQKASAEVKYFIDGLDVGERAIPTLRTLPKDFSLPSAIKRKIKAAKDDIEKYHREREKFSYGIVSEIYPGCQQVYNFRLGDWHAWSSLGEFVANDPHYAYEFEPITIKEFVEGFKANIAQLDEELKQGGIEAAMAARKKFYLERISEKISKAVTPLEVIKIMKSDNTVPSPNTGVYVVYSGNLKPRIVKAEAGKERLVARMYGVYISDEMVFLQAMEVPEDALKYVKDLPSEEFHWHLSPSETKGKNKSKKH